MSVMHSACQELLILFDLITEKYLKSRNEEAICYDVFFTVRLVSVSLIQTFSSENRSGL
jgi:hypothetical protein